MIFFIFCKIIRDIWQIGTDVLQKTGGHSTISSSNILLNIAFFHKPCDHGWIASVFPSKTAHCALCAVPTADLVQLVNYGARAASAIDTKLSSLVGWLEGIFLVSTILLKSVYAWMIYEFGCCLAQQSFLPLIEQIVSLTLRLSLRLFQIQTALWWKRLLLFANLWIERFLTEKAITVVFQFYHSPNKFRSNFDEFEFEFWQKIKSDISVSNW